MMLLCTFFCLYAIYIFIFIYSKNSSHVLFYIHNVFGVDMWYVFLIQVATHLADFATAYQVMQSSNILPCREGQAGRWRQIITTSLRRHHRICLVWCIYPNILVFFLRLVNEWNSPRSWYIQLCLYTCITLYQLLFLSFLRLLSHYIYPHYMRKSNFLCFVDSR